MASDAINYKLYLNKICALTRLSKQQHYSQFFHDNLRNVKKTWEGINSILTSGTKSAKSIRFIRDPNNNNNSLTSRISSILNDHFTSAGPKLANKLPTPQGTYSDFLNSPYSPINSFAFNLATPTEVALEITWISYHKSHGLYSCPTYLLKSASKLSSATS